jgi:DNA-binding MarR family transcriptional regulator
MRQVSPGSDKITRMQKRQKDSMTDSTHTQNQVDNWGNELSSRAIMFHHALGERMGLSATEHKAADIIRRFGSMTAGELAEQTGLTTGAVTGLVDRLEKDGYVRREHDKSDRRRVIIKPVAHGKYEEVQGLLAPVLESMNALLAKYGKEEAEAISDFAAKAAEVLREETARMRQVTRRQHS